jgi:16S rRNA pseudouridine516 synthase
MRLDKFICHGTGLSRQQVQRAVRAGNVTVNNNVIRKADQQIDVDDIVKLDGETIEQRKPRYFMLHKPEGYVCANSDGNYPVVLDLLDEDWLDSLQIVGRLDLDTTGLVLLTDDGQWNHRMTAPSRHCSKCYRVKLQMPLSAIAAEQLRGGVLLDNEKKPTQPAQLECVAEQENIWLLTIHEGKYHQVKRMFAAVGNHVLELHRERIGSISLDLALASGEYRALTAAEIAGAD